MRELGLEAKSSIIYVKVDRDSVAMSFVILSDKAFVLGLRNSPCLELATNFPLFVP